jgi:hypothetical protein
MNRSLTVYLLFEIDHRRLFKCTHFYSRLALTTKQEAAPNLTLDFNPCARLCPQLDCDGSRPTRPAAIGGGGGPRRRADSVIAIVRSNSPPMVDGSVDCLTNTDLKLKPPNSSRK